MNGPGLNELAFIRSCGVENEEEFLQKCRIYGDFLYETNDTMNLTRIPPQEFWTKHVCDSLSLALRHDMRAVRQMCDVGCGAGLPSLILAAAFPGTLQVTAVDSTGKKVKFVGEAALRMGLKNLRALQARANELGHKEGFRRAFRLVTARAVGTAETLLREASGLVAADGVLILYRTPAQAEPEAEWLSGTAAKSKVARFELTEALELPGENVEAGTRLFLKLYPAKNTGKK